VSTPEREGVTASGDHDEGRLRSLPQTLEGTAAECVPRNGSRSAPLGKRRGDRLSAPSPKALPHTATN
jgi:hypothetical protein